MDTGRVELTAHLSHGNMIARHLYAVPNSDSILREHIVHLGHNEHGNKISS